MRKKSRIPNFKTIEEEAGFWGTHSTADYIDEMTPVNFTYEPKPERELKKGVTIRLAPSLKKTVDKIAARYDISPSSLIRMWVVDRVRDSAKSNYESPRL